MKWRNKRSREAGRHFSGFSVENWQQHGKNIISQEPDFLEKSMVIGTQKVATKLATKSKKTWYFGQK